MIYMDGEEVLARPPKTNEFHKGKVLSSRGERYKIRFDYGKEYTVHQDDIKISRPTRSKSRSSSRTAKKSPTRQSPSRRTTRRSPARSPTTASKKAAIYEAKYATITLPRIEVPNDKISSEMITNTQSLRDENSETMALYTRLKEMRPVTRRSTRLYSAILKPETDDRMVMLMKNNNRAVSLPTERKIYDFTINEKERGSSVQRNQDLTKILHYEKDVKPDSQITEKRLREINLVNEPQEWGGRIGTLALICFSPLLIILPQFLCTKEKCRFDYPKIPRDLDSYLNLKTFLLYCGYTFFIVCVSILPIGKIVDGQQNKMGRLKYRINGLLSTILLMIILGACIYNGMKVHDFILDNIVQLSFSSWLLGTILSFFLYVKSGRTSIANLNIYASTNSSIYNFWQGREINPRIGPLDFKITLFRIATIGMVIVNVAIMIKAIEEAESIVLEHLNVPALLASSLEIFYAMDLLLFESKILTTFEIMYEGAGYMVCTGRMIFPFLPTLTTRYMLYQKARFNYYSGVFLLTYIIGYAIFRISNSQKNQFRQNPLSPAVAHLETIQTLRGKKLLVSGLWGHVRHPNYLGDIIVWWSVACISMACDILPYYYPLCCTGLLIHNAIRDNERCKRRYGLAWEEYTKRVKYMILYRVF